MVNKTNPSSCSGQTCRGDVVGKIRNYKELSGLVASHRNPGIFYSVEDSQNDELVYAFYENGTLLGKIWTIFWAEPC